MESMQLYLKKKRIDAYMCSVVEWLRLAEPQILCSESKNITWTAGL